MARLAQTLETRIRENSRVLEFHCYCNRSAPSTQSPSSEWRNSRLNGTQRGANGWADRPAQLRDVVETAQSTVSEKLMVCWSEPDVAVTLNVEVTGCTGGVVDVVPPPLPPHPLRSPSPMKTTASTNRPWKRRRFLKPNPHRMAASAASGRNGRGLLCIADVAVEVATVSVVDAAAVPAGVTVAGEKLHDAPDGRPEQANDTAESILDPFAQN